MDESNGRAKEYFDQIWQFQTGVVARGSIMILSHVTQVLNQCKALDCAECSNAGMLYGLQDDSMDKPAMAKFDREHARSNGAAMEPALTSDIRLTSRRVSCFLYLAGVYC